MHRVLTKYMCNLLLLILYAAPACAFDPEKSITDPTCVYSEKLDRHMHGSAAHFNWMLSLRRPNSCIGPDSEQSGNKSLVELANVLFVFRTLGIGVRPLARAQQLGFDACFVNAISFRIAVVFLPIVFKNKAQTCFISRHTCHEVLESIQTLERSSLFLGKKRLSKIPRSIRRSRMISISHSGAHAMALFCCESKVSLPQ